MSFVGDHVIKRFWTLYGEPKTQDPDGFLAEYETALRGFTEPILRQAVDRVVKANEYRSWPMPGEVCKACADIGVEVGAKAKREYREPQIPMPPAPSPEAVARVKALAAEFARKHRMNELSDRKPLPDVSREAMDALQSASLNRFHRGGYKA